MWSNLLVALTLAGSAWAQFSISTPASLVQCQPASIKWTGGESPFILAVIPGGEVSAATISTLSTSLTTSPYTWNVNLPTGTYITLRLTDAKGNITYSSPLTIQAGADSSCLDTTASTSGLATGAVTTTGSGSSTLTATTSASGAGTSVTAAAAVSSARSSAAAASSHSSMSGAASSASAGSSLRASSSSTPVRSASSAAASTTGGAVPTAAFGYPAVVAGLLGAVAVLA